GQIAEDQRQPRAPDEKLKDHHEEKLQTNCFIHRRDLTVRVGEGNRGGKDREANANGAGRGTSNNPTIEHPTSNNPTSSIRRLPNHCPPLNLLACGLPPIRRPWFSSTRDDGMS